MNSISIVICRVTQSQVGDMFVVRNSGNMIPHARNYGYLSFLFKNAKVCLGSAGYEVSVTTEPAALELAVKRGGINHVIVCGHSDCKASFILTIFLSNFNSTEKFSNHD